MAAVYAGIGGKLSQQRNNMPPERPNQTAAMEFIGPDIAAKYMGLNSRNRPIRNKRVKELKEELESNNFKVNGDTITFDTDGRLQDGQHRLLAIIESGIPVWCWVIRGVPVDGFDTKDQGAVRSTRDTFSMVGEPNANVLGRLTTLVWKLENDCLGKVVLPNNRQRLAIFKDNAEKLREAVEFASLLSCGHIMSESVPAFLYFIGKSIDEIKTKEFLRQVANGDHTDNGQPSWVFRETLTRKRASKKRVPHGRDEFEACGIKALQAHFDGRKISLLRQSDQESFPRLHATLVIPS